MASGGTNRYKVCYAVSASFRLRRFTGLSFGVADENRRNILHGPCVACSMRPILAFLFTVLTTALLMEGQPKQDLRSRLDEQAPQWLREYDVPSVWNGVSAFSAVEVENVECSPTFP